jgi:hypothetical protein
MNCEARIPLNQLMTAKDQDDELILVRLGLNPYP